MQLLFRFLAIVMFIMMFSIIDLFNRGLVGFGIAFVMVLVAGLGTLGCCYLGGWWDIEYEEED